MENTLYFGDNLPLLRQYIKDESIDLIYLDPPFNSKVNYNVIFKGPTNKESSSSQITAFEDTWHWQTGETEFEFNQLKKGGGAIADVMKGLELVIGKNDLLAYLTMMAIRLRELHRVLKDTGSLYLHCDPTASHYLKIILDAIFEGNNFKREIIWSLETVSGFKSQVNGWVRGHDIILYYVKSDNFIFNKLYQSHKKEYIQRFKKKDKTGRKYRDDRSGGRKQFLDETKGRMFSDVWNDIMSFQQAATSKEIMGYPTQKPITLLERIIKASSNEGDVILDPFCGCGTAIVAAQKLNRKWVGMDITHLAVGLMEQRIKEQFGIKPKVVGHPNSFSGAENLFKRSPLDFERWAVTRIDGLHPNKKQVGDGGVDGRGYLGEKGEYKIIASVKGGKSLTPSMVAELKGVMEKENAVFGILITVHKPTDGMLREASIAGLVDVGLHHFPKIQIWTISNFFSGIMPNLP